MTLSGIGVALVIMALLILPTRKSFAFAAVIQAMQQVKSIHWTVKVDGAAQPEKSLEGSDEGNVVEGWARLDKPAIALLFGGGGEVKMLVTPDKHTMITNDKQLMDIPVPWLEGKGKDKEAALRDFILAQLVLPTKDAFQGVGKNDNINLLNYFGQERFQREDVVFEGKRVVQFTLDQRFREAGFTVSLWVDPDTHLILRSETRIPNPSQGQPDVVTIAAQLRYDEEPPIGIFDLPTK